jgi:ribonuclease P protein component
MSPRDAAHAGAPDESFSKNRRVTSSADFRALFDRGGQQAGRYMVMWAQASELAEPRVGVIASKRTFRHSVMRNRAKRLLREAFRRNCDTLDAPANILLVARARILGASPQEVARDFRSLSRRVGIAGKVPR